MLVAKDHPKNVDVEPIYYQTSKYATRAPRYHSQKCRPHVSTFPFSLPLNIWVCTENNMNISPNIHIELDGCGQIVVQKKIKYIVTRLTRTRPLLVFRDKTKTNKCTKFRAEIKRAITIETHREREFWGHTMVQKKNKKKGSNPPDMELCPPFLFVMKQMYWLDQVSTRNLQNI